MIKAVLSDFDGTLVNLKAEYDPAILPQIVKLKERNITFALATGRSFYGIVRRIIEQLQIDGVHIFHGGSYIYDTVEKKELLYQPISEKSSRWIIEYLLKTGLLFSIETKEGVWMSHVQEVPTYSKDIPLQPVKSFDSYSSVLKILLFAALNKLPEKKTTALFEEIKINCIDVSLLKIVRNGYVGGDITSEKATKHTAVLEYMKLRGLEKNEVVAIGDDYNDYPLFTAAGHSIAMGNAPQEVLDIADFVVPPTHEGGMKKALQIALSINS